DVAFVDFSHAVADELLDLLGSISAAASQCTHLTGHHGKASAMLSSTCGFDRCIQCQDIGLKGNAINDTDEVGDLLAAGINALHGVHDFAHSLTPFGDHALGFACTMVCRLGMVGVVRHGRT